MAFKFLQPRSRQDIAAALVLLALTLITFHRLAFTDWILARGDTYSYHYPYWHARNEALLAGRLPLWTPDLFMGAPLLANPQIGTFYPPNWLVAPLTAPDGVRWSAIGHVFWTALGAYALARRTLGVGLVGGLIGAAIFAFGGHIGGHVEQINQLQGLSWLPWLLFLFDRAIDPIKNGRDVGRDGRAIARPYDDANDVVGTPFLASVQPKNEINNGWEKSRPYALSALANTILLAMALALQVFSGHTQTVFISGVALGIYALCVRPIRGILTLIGAAVGAGLLAIPQLIPTLELSSLSNRRGGFNVNQATAFSFNPFVTGRGLLPSFDRMIFSEYIAYPGIIGLGLAWIGAWANRIGGGNAADNAGVVPTRFLRVRRWFAVPQTRWIVLALLGLFLAYGLYNPLYLVLAGLPGFNLFRVPARWLVLFALGVAMLAAVGAEALLQKAKNTTQRRGDAKAQSRTFLRRYGIVLLFPLLILALMIAAPLVERTPDLTPTYPPETVTWIAWVIALIVATIGVAVVWRTDNAGVVPTKIRQGLGIVVVVGSVTELILASGALAYNQLVPPDAFSAQRFTISQMLAYNEDEIVPGRILSLSDLQFDPGDRAALERRYDALGITGEARALAFDTVKLREVLAANQPLLWGIPSIDGFDGGLLPTGYYTAFTSLMLPEGELRTLDGRLREMMYSDACGGACIPDPRWMIMTDTRYLLTDKVYDLVRDGVFFDTTFSVSGIPLHYLLPSDFEANAIEVVYSCPTEPCDPPPLAVSNADRWIQVSATLSGEPLDRYLWARYELDANTQIVAAAFNMDIDTPSRTDQVIRAVSLVNRTEDAVTFEQLTPLGANRVLSSDIKLYRMATNGRAIQSISNYGCTPDDMFGTEAALDRLRDDIYSARVILASNDCTTLPEIDPIYSSRPADIREYQPTRVVIEKTTEQGGYLLLKDAYYPGWVATVDGEPTTVYRANVMFRAVWVPEGAHTVVFEYKPSWMPGIFIAGGALWVIAIAGVAVSVGIKNRRAS